MNQGLKKLITNYGRDFWAAASHGIAPLLVGPPGVYKSYSSAVLAKQIHEKACVRVAWCDVPVTLFQLERKRFQHATDEVIDGWKQVPWLVIDDFAMVQVGSWQHGVLCEIAMHRFSQGRPTCWTGNVQFARGQQNALVDAVGAQLARRLMEGSEGFRLAIPGAV